MRETKLNQTNNPFVFLWKLVCYFLFNCFLMLDVLMNFWPLLGDPQETISSRAGKGVLRGSTVWIIAAAIIDYLALTLFDDENHCHRSIHHDVGYFQLVSFEGVGSVIKWVFAMLATGYVLFYFVKGIEYLLSFLVRFVDWSLMHLFDWFLSGISFVLYVFGALL